VILEVAPHLHAELVVKEKEDAGQDFYRHSMSIMMHLLKEIDNLVIEPLMVLDPESFDSKPVESEAAQSAHRKRQIIAYNSDLRRAFEYLNSLEN
jgi:hypothetical protein